jgi:hypothetical protein
MFFLAMFFSKSRLAESRSKVEATSVSRPSAGGSPVVDQISSNIIHQPSDRSYFLPALSSFMNVNIWRAIDEELVCASQGSWSRGASKLGLLGLVEVGSPNSRSLAAGEED